MANLWNSLSYLIPGLRGWRLGLNAFNGKSLIDNDAKGMLSDIGQGLSDTIFGTTYNQQALQEDAQQFNAAQAQLSRDWQESMYQRYESPAAMMQQFRDAGLNPALMYGGASPSPSFGSDMASVGTPSAQHGNISLSDALLGAQFENIKAATHKLDIDALAVKDKLPKELTLMDETIEQVKSISNLNGQLVKESSSRVNVNDATVKKLYEEQQKLFTENEFLSQTLDARMKIVFAERDIKATDAEYLLDNIQSQLSNLRESTKLMRSERFFNARQHAHLTAIDMNLSHMSRYLDEQSAFIQKQGDNIPIQNVIGFINAGSNAVHTATESVSEIYGMRTGKSVPKPFSKPGTGIKPNYGFE